MPEHVLAQWLGRLLPDTTRYEHGVVPESTPYLATARSGFQGTSAGMELTNGAVCDDCNHHWMSDLETRVSDILSPLIMGQPGTLKLSQQTEVAEWVFKTYAMFQQTKFPERQIIVPDHYRWLYEHRTPPPGTVIKIGARTEAPGDGFYEIGERLLSEGVPDARYAEPGPIAGDAVHAFRAVFILGTVLVEMTGTNRQGAVHLEWDEQITGAFNVIWPIQIRAVRWPPRGLFNAASAEAFKRAERLGFLKVKGPYGPEVFGVTDGRET